MTTENNTPQVFRHSTPVQLRFNDVDQFGHVNNAVYFELYDIAKTKYLVDVLGTDVASSDIHPVIANIQADFITPVHYGDEVEIKTAVTHLGHTSFVMTQEAVNLKKNETVCRCRTVMVCFSVAQGKPVDIPQDLRQMFRQYEKNNQL